MMVMAADVGIGSGHSAVADQEQGRRVLDSSRLPMLAHLPSGRFAPNSAWAICTAITHNLLHAPGTLTNPSHAVTPRRHPPPAHHHRPCRIGAPATPPSAAPARALALGGPVSTLWTVVFATGPSHRLTHDPRPDQKAQDVEKAGRPAALTSPTAHIMINF